MNQNDRLLAVLSHVLGIFTSFVGPLVIYLIADKENVFVRKNAQEALNFQITLIIGYVVSAILVLLLIGILMFWIVYIANIVFCILAAVAASKDEIYSYPFNIRLVK